MISYDDSSNENHHLFHYGCWAVPRFLQKSDPLRCWTINPWESHVMVIPCHPTTLDHPNFRKKKTTFGCSWVKYIQISNEKIWKTSEQLVTSPFLKNKMVVTIRSHWFLVASIGGKLPSNWHVETRGIQRSACWRYTRLLRGNLLQPFLLRQLRLLRFFPARRPWWASAETKKKGIAARSHEI